MTLALRIVCEAARIRRRLRRPRAVAAEQRGLRFIGEHAPGRSFADIGGMWGVDGEFALRAAAAGASAVTLFDGGEPTPRFLERAAQQKASIRCVQGDLEDPLSVGEIGPHQIVWCTGVVYHTPNPLAQLMHLRQITTELLFLGSSTMPEVPGFPQACLFYPQMAARDRAPLARGVANPARAIGLGTAFDGRPMYGHGNWWWGISPSALRAMLATARFEVVEEVRVPQYPWAVQFIARPVPVAPSLPPVDYYRKRGERVRQGRRPPPFDGYYEKGEEAEAGEEDIFPRLEGMPRPDTGPPDPGEGAIRRDTGPPDPGEGATRPDTVLPNPGAGTPGPGSG